MSKFTRPAPWLRRFFTPSQTEFKEPGLLSEDVSLIQPYDGGGWAVDSGPTKTFSAVSATVAAAYTTLFTTGPQEISRFVSFAIKSSAGVIPSCNVVLNQPGGAHVAISEVLTPITAEHTSIRLFTKVVGPDVEVRVSHWGGDAATVIAINFMEYRVPIGVVFYV